MARTAKKRGSALETARRSVTQHMPEHLEHARAIRDAVVAGRLHDAQRTAEILAGHWPKAILESWVPFVVDLRTAAKAVVRAETPQAAGEAVGALAGACGRCHAAMRQGPRFPDVEQPAKGTDLAAVMRRHQWAADRLWEGVVQDSAQRWTQGVAGFEALPPCNEDPGGERGDPDVAEALRARLTELKQGAAKADDLEPRAAIYGELLGTCSTCHLSGC